MSGGDNSGPSGGAVAGGGGGGVAGGMGGAGGSGGGSACGLPGPMTVTTLDSGISGPLHVDDRNVYFLVADETTLQSAPKSGGAPAIAYLGTTQSNDFAVDANTIYVVNDGSVVFVDKASGAVRSAAAAGAPCGASYLAVSNGDVYWVQGCTPPAATPLIGALPAGATSQRTLVAETSHAPARALVADDAHVFWADDAGVWRVARSGGTPELLSRDTDGRALATDGHSLFVARAASVYTISAPFVEVPIYDEANVTELASDGHALWVAGDNGVARVSADGRTRAVVTPDAAYGVTVDDRYVYFATSGGLFKACK